MTAIPLTQLPLSPPPGATALPWQVDGQPKHFTVRFLSRLQTKGGFLFDVALSYDNQETRHRWVPP